jgi:tetratricopeptide (TPR) repeat protein
MDDTLAAAHASLAYVKYKYEWTWADAEREFERAIALDPNNAYAHINYSLYLSNMGKHDEAIAEAKRALELDPLSIDNNNCLGWIFYVARHYDRAIEQYQNTLEMSQDLILARYFLAMSYVAKDMYSEAFAEVQKGIERSGGEVPQLKSALGILYSLMGRRDEAMKVLQNVIELSEQKYVGPYDIALIYTSLGKKDQAFEWLEKAYEERSAWLPQIKVHQMFDSLRSDPRFIAMLKKMNLE